ncbi:CHAD domain-containing protein [Georgenia sp. AZ-5]|uniref:CYTH and CHAD domain-containing protein n=1 Tax=Georgenia sp. AZ-5 TaxID=3367526 RepID=UPI0037543DB4
MEQQTEVERKFAVDEAFELGRVRWPDGVGLVPAGERVLTSTYLDTADLRLAARGVSLRRRSGGHDEGWHLKLPRGQDAREEIREPLEAGADDAPPERLAALVKAYARGRPLEPVARIRTTRAVHRLRAGGDGELVAELADDHVAAEVVGAEPGARTWREIEVELVGGPPELLHAAARALLEAGAVPSPAPSKLARALGPRFPARPQEQELDVDGPAAAVVMTYLRAQVDALLEADPGVRTDAPDAVHQMRVATRRLRTALKTFRPVLAREHTDRLRGELRWIATVLGDARDAEVLRRRLREEAADAPPSAERQAAVGRIDSDLAARYDTARAELLRELDGPRYLRLLDDLDTLLESPPLTERAPAEARRELPRLARRAFKAVRRAHGVAESAGTDAALHEVRKAAKRARYAGEALRPAFGKRAKRFAAAMEAVQDVLGEHQDSVVARETLTTMAARARAAGQDTFHLGRLAEREATRAAAARAAYAEAWRAASRKRLLRWTR